MLTKATKLILLTLSLLASGTTPGTCAASQSDFMLTQSRNQNSVHEEQSDGSDNWTWTHSDNNERIEMHVVKPVEFTEDYTDVKSVGQNGSIRVEETRGGETRRFEAWREPSGQIRREYKFNHETREFDADARTWLERVLLQEVR